jgi:hypothetical protein
VWRHNDDFRLAADTWAEANAAFEALDREVRGIGLSLNEHKCFILTARRYGEWLAEPEERWNEINAEVEVDLRSVGGYDDADPDIEIPDAALLEAAAATALERALQDDDGVDRLQEEVNRQLATASLNALRLANSSAGLPHIAKLLNREPQFSHAISRYLTATTEVDEDAVAATCEAIVEGDGIYLSAWSSLWLIETVREFSELPEGLRKWLAAMVEARRPDALRARATLALAERELIDIEPIAELYNTVALSSRPDIVSAAASVADEGDVRVRALARDAPLNRWIIEATRDE